MTASTAGDSSPLPELPSLAQLTSGGPGATGHPVLDAVLTALRGRESESDTTVAYYDDAP
ncbi:hypothetical protein ACWD4J_04610 [Streptomyces sp. NPDC002577]